MSILFYRRPDYIKREHGPLEKSSCQKYVDRNASTIKPPEALSFDNVVHGKTLPPVTVSDFLDYTMYISHDAENLQFYLWYHDYIKRFDALTEQEKALSREWQFDYARPSPGGWPFEAPEIELRKVAEKTAAKVEQTNVGYNFDDFSGPPKAMGIDETASDRSYSIAFSNSASESRTDASNQMVADAVNAQVGLKWQGFDIQPCRTEITRVISTYLSNSSPRALNISHSTRSSILHALQHTTHPSAFIPAIDLIEIHLRHHSHPNFIRWTICNGNAPRVFFVRWMGVITTAKGFIVAILLALSSVNRWWRLFAAIFWMIGITTLIAAYKGLCVILHMTHDRTLRPWEDPSATYGTFDDHAAGAAEMTRPSLTYSHSHFDEKFRPSGESNAYTPPEPATPAESNSPEAQWKTRYNRLPLIRKIFDRSVVVQEHAVRVIQDRIVRQAQAWALIWTIILCVVFVAVPKGNFY